VLAGRVRQRPVVRPLAAAAVAVLAVGGIALGTAAAVSRPEPVAAAPQLQPTAAPQTVTVTATPTAQPDDTAQLDAIAAAVAMPGVSVRREPGAVRVVFNQGLFSSGTTFADGSADVLDRLAPRLRRVPGITVVGQSVAVPGGEASGGSGTALARARVVAQRLARTGHLPLTRLTLASGDQAHPLFPGAARNRTVSLLLTA
jgi:type VI secretion system protein ImpK